MFGVNAVRGECRSGVLMQGWMVKIELRPDRCWQLMCPNPISRCRIFWTPRSVIPHLRMIVVIDGWQLPSSLALSASDKSTSFSV